MVPVTTNQICCAYTYIYIHTWYAPLKLPFSLVNSPFSLVNSPCFLVSMPQISALFSCRLPKHLMGAQGSSKISLVQLSTGFFRIRYLPWFILMKIVMLIFADEKWLCHGFVMGYPAEIKRVWLGKLLSMEVLLGKNHLLTTCLSTGFSNPSESSPVSQENLPLNLFPQENLRKSQKTPRKSPISSHAAWKSKLFGHLFRGMFCLSTWRFRWNFTSFCWGFRSKNKKYAHMKLQFIKRSGSFFQGPERSRSGRYLRFGRRDWLTIYLWGWWVWVMAICHLMIYNHVMYVQLVSGFNPRSTKGNRKTVLWASQKTHPRICNLWDMPWSFSFPWSH